MFWPISDEATIHWAWCFLIFPLHGPGDGDFMVKSPVGMGDMLIYTWPLFFSIASGGWVKSQFSTPKIHGCVWKCCVPLNPMVLLIIIPMKNGYFIGNIPNIFRQKYLHMIQMHIMHAKSLVHLRLFSLKRINRSTHQADNSCFIWDLLRN